MTDLGLGILSIFAEAQRWWGARERTGVKECSDPEEMRRVYRETNNEHGKCRSCPLPALPGKKQCARHKAESKRRYYAHLERSRGYAPKPRAGNR